MQRVTINDLKLEMEDSGCGFSAVPLSDVLSKRNADGETVLKFDHFLCQTCNLTVEVLFHLQTDVEREHKHPGELVCWGCYLTHFFRL